MPIVIAPSNSLLRVTKILTDEKTKKHLESLGITINSNLVLISENGGNIIIQVKESRLALDKTIAMKILVV